MMLIGKEAVTHDILHKKACETVRCRFSVDFL